MLSGVRMEDVTIISVKVNNNKEGIAYINGPAIRNLDENTLAQIIGMIATLKFRVLQYHIDQIVHNDKSPPETE